MKKLFSLFIFLSQISAGQDTKGRFELGSTLATVNLYYTDPYVTSVEYMNGLFFRYSKERLGFRTHTSYFNSSSSNTYTLEAWPSGAVGNHSDNKIFRIGAGAQFSILKQAEWFYTFLDISYEIFIPLAIITDQCLKKLLAHQMVWIVF